MTDRDIFVIFGLSLYLFWLVALTICIAKIGKEWDDFKEKIKTLRESR